MVRLSALAIAVASSLAGDPAAANPVKSLYTTVDLKVCKKIQGQHARGAWQCPGLAGIPVYVAERSYRQFVSAGTDADKRRAATQTLGAVNSIFERGHHRALIEWRFVRRGERELPYAIIVRFHTLNDETKGDVLVVLKVDDRETCHVAHIDALANQNAITLARFIADETARNFDCRQEPFTEGVQGKSPM
jgi:hypothetical protein